MIMMMEVMMMTAVIMMIVPNKHSCFSNTFSKSCWAFDSLDAFRNINPVVVVVVLVAVVMVAVGVVVKVYCC